uniref:Uncharacterized protein n=1 Tax=Anguilla anguilla TaxID=7936 RepID=A0A0E9SLF8_ANGAN
MFGSKSVMVRQYSSFYTI